MKGIKIVYDLNRTKVWSDTARAVCTCVNGDWN